MSDTMDECRAAVAEFRHERGECYPPHCYWCAKEAEPDYDPDFQHDLVREDKAMNGDIELRKRN